MISLERSMTHRWIIDKNVNSKDIISDFAAIVQNANKGFDFNEIINQTHSTGSYRGRSTQGSTITIGVRLLQACYYMFGYSLNTDNNKKIFMPSPMTMNILSTEDSKKQKENYLINLYCLQYPHPFNRTPNCFQLYTGRLLIKLLLDNRIDNKLYIDECIWFLPFIETCNVNIYENLISSIIEYRKLSYYDKSKLFMSVPDYNYLFANVTHEMNYYFIRLFQDFGVLSVSPDVKHNEGKLFKFKHGNGKTYRNDAWKTHGDCSGYIQLSADIIDSAKKLNKRFSAFDTPTRESDEGILTKRNWLTNIYETEPLAYLSCINATVISRRNEVSNVISNMIDKSKFGSRDGKEFERALKPFMELFRETANVEIISGAGNTDLLCAMEMQQNEDAFYKINVEAKTRKSSVSDINPIRITKHITKHGAKFCIIVAPKFASGVFFDIQNYKIVTVRSEDLGAYCYRECIDSEDGYADFNGIYDIIANNFGKDITAELNNLTVQRHGFAYV